ncbi:hypothetical protein Hanom_Chr13g01201011 [Helianthus anomalus]
MPRENGPGCGGVAGETSWGCSERLSEEIGRRSAGLRPAPAPVTGGTREKARGCLVCGCKYLC